MNAPHSPRKKHVLGKRIQRNTLKRNQFRSLLVESLEARCTPTASLLPNVEIGANFSGTTRAQSGFIPPDTMGAVGPNTVVELINGAFATYNRDGSLIQRTTLNNFWSTALGAAGNPTAINGSAFDPRIHFDPNTNRFFAAALDGARTANSRYLVGVTTGSDPAPANWRAFAIDADPADLRWADFPSIGLDQTALYVSVNLFPIPGSPVPDDRTALLGVPLSSLTAATPNIGGMRLQNNINPGDTGFSFQPAIDQSFTSSPLPAISRFNGNLLYQFDIPGAFLTGTDIPPQSAANFINSAITTSPFARQPGPNDNIETGSIRIRSNVIARNGRLWAVEGVDVGGRAAARWYEINEATNTIVQTGVISDPNLDLYYPSISIGATNKVVIGFSGSSDTTPIGAYFVAGQTAGGATTFGPIVQAVNGAGSYLALDGSGRNRWGDYSATVNDPNNPNDFWTFQEFVNADNSWQIRLTQVRVRSALIIEGDSGAFASDDVIRLVRNSADPSILEAYLNGVLVQSIALRDLEYIDVRGKGGNDTLIVDDTNGLIDVPGRIRFDGGEGFDRVDVRNTSANGGVATGVTERVIVGANNGKGRHELTSGPATQTIDFDNVEPITSNVAAANFSITSAPGIASLLDSANSINYTTGTLLGSTWGRVTVDAFEPIEFRNKTALTIDAGSGEDSINLNNPLTPTGLTTINVNGQDPTALDRLLVNGTTAVDTFRFSPSAVDAGQLTITALPTVNVTRMEKLSINGRGADDFLVLITPTGADRVVFDTGSSAGDGAISLRSIASNTALLGLDYVGFGTGSGSVTFQDAAGVAVRADDVVIRGRDLANSDERYQVNSLGRVQIFDEPNNVALSLRLDTPGARSLALHGLAGDDIFDIPGDQVFPQGVFVEGGDPSGSDVLNFTGTGASVTADFGRSLIQQTGAAPITITGIEIANIDLVRQDILVNATSGSDDVEFTPTGPASGTVRLLSASPAIDAPVINFTNSATFRLDMIAGSPSADDHLFVNYTSDPDNVLVNAVTRVISAGPNLEAVNFSNADALTVRGKEGDDRFTVTPAAGIPIFIDGGDPIGETAGDSIQVVVPPNVAAILEVGPENDEGSFVIPGVERVSFDHIEAINVFDATCAIIKGSGQDDDFTVVARDASTNPGANGVRDFTVQINNGLTVYYQNVPMLYLDGLGGDDDFVIRATAPNNADWNVDVFVAGGPPSTGETPEGDRVVLETPFTQGLIFTPSGPDTATMIVDEANNGAFDAASDSRILMGSFVADCNGDGTPDYVSSPGGVERVEYDGQGLTGAVPSDTITINGTASDDTTDVQPTGVGTGTFSSGLSPLFVFKAFATLNVNGGSGGFDRVSVTGTEGVDTVTSPAPNAVLLGNRVNINAGIDQFELNTLGGNDSITLGLTASTLDKIIRGGDGDDNINLSASVDATIFGGAGADIIVGTPIADAIFGGGGNDTITGGPGADALYGEDGSDIIIWNPGDGSDLVEGGSNEADVLRFNGSAAGEIFTLNAVGTRLELLRNVGAIDMDVAGIETVELNALAGDDSITVNDLYATDVKLVSLDLGPEGTDSVTINGREIADAMAATVAGGVVSVIGLRYDTQIRSAASPDSLTINTLGGNDTVTTSDALNGVFVTTVNGGDGDDFLSGFGTLNGNAGNDTLIGGIFGQTINGGDGNDRIEGGNGIDTLNGGAGEDVFVPGYDGLNDIVDGGADFDTILVEGTSAADRLEAAQLNATSLRYRRWTIGGAIITDETDTLVAGTVESVSIRAGSGDDIIRVIPSDALIVAANQAQSLGFDVDGGPSATGDRLTVTDDGPGDTTIHRVSADPNSGSFQVGALQPVNYVGVEYATLNPIDEVTGGTGADGNGRLFVFKADPFEENNARTVATHLGAAQTINIDPTIDPAGDAIFGLPGDSDWYRVVAEKTGTIDFQVYFRQQGPLSNGRAGLPGNGNLSVDAFDADGTLVAGFGANDATDDERKRIPVVAGQTYFFRVYGVTADTVNQYGITVINTAPPVPTDLELNDIVINGTTNPPGQGDNSDTGRSQTDNITYDNTPVIRFRLDDGIFLHDLPGNGVNGNPPDEVIPIPFNTDQTATTTTPGYRVAVFDEGQPQQPGTLPQVPIGFARRIAEGVYEFNFDTDSIDPNFTLTDGSHFLSARVQIVDVTTAPALPNQTGFGDRSVSLEINVDTAPPPVFFGLSTNSTDGLSPDSDSGVLATIGTFSDRATNDPTPTFWGRAEADSIVTIYLDVNNNGAVDNGDIFLGRTTANPFDGTNQFPNGAWEITSQVNLNDPQARNLAGVFTPIPRDGVRRILVTAEDVAGNLNPGAGQNTQSLTIFLDTQGPQITNVEINNRGNPYDLFDPKPSTDGPTPLVNRLVVSVRDLPNRVVPDWVYAALDANVAIDPGHYQVKGDYNGIIPIQSIVFAPDPTVNGQPATGILTINFFRPLPDDRFTLTITDDLVDPVGNKLDGESNAAEPQEAPNFIPGGTGDGVPGGNFVARFTVDSRPEVGTWAAGTIWVDTNGNESFDPGNLDFVNRDITYNLGYTSDNIFAGNFVRAANGVADRFDKIAAYGRVGSQWRWMIDVNNDGAVIDPAGVGPDVIRVDPANVNGSPVAGRFDNNDANGDEVGLFTGTTWWFDTNHDFNVDRQLATSMRGLPVVGDFDGDGFDDLATWSNDTFQIDFARGVRGGWDGAADVTFKFGFIGTREIPVAADMDQDGTDDIGLWTPDRSGVAPLEASEWYIIVSNGDKNYLATNTFGPGNRLVPDPLKPGSFDVKFTPVPFGPDKFIQFGDEFSMPLLGNFDPPVTTPATASDTNPNDPLDVNNDGKVSPIDALLVIDYLNKNKLTGSTSGFERGAPYLDTSRDKSISPIDALLVVDFLNTGRRPQGEATDAAIASVAAETSTVSEDLLALVAMDIDSATAKKK